MTDRTPMRAISRRATLVAALAMPAVARAQGDVWPSRPVRFIVPYAPGGGTDVTTRLIAEGMTNKFGKQFVVENRAGANGIVGTQVVSRAEPDGYTFGAQTSTHIMARRLGPLPYDPVTDFTPISLMARYPLVMMASARAPFTDIAGLIAEAKKQPGGMAQGTSDAQSSFAARQFARAAGIEINEVPYRGSGAYLADLSAGHLPVAWGSPATAAPMAASGQVKLIGVSSPERSPFLPNVPTITESGVTGADFIGWFGLFGPARLPRPIAVALNTAINEYIVTPAMQARYATLANEFSPMDLDQLMALMRADDERWARAQAEGLIERQP
ncbi:Bug family tripartite tricarboxylate transporter substrate binding protein [Humitalea sp. 24SJ18S-53]|uniref:Bug family tripartite tricarboxylate transporter substrate binding protein n=1 Tax=Humitalea sp. 24SJ18S-53 TaxID=3422307 RepID=UPI003D67E866